MCSVGNPPEAGDVRLGDATGPFSALRSGVGAVPRESRFPPCSEMDSFTSKSVITVALDVGAVVPASMTQQPPLVPGDS